MVKFFLLFLILVLNGCVSSSAIRRGLANEEEKIPDLKTQDRIESFIRQELKRAEETSGRYRYLSVPPSGYQSVTHGKEIKLVEESKEYEKIEELTSDFIDGFPKEFRKFIFSKFSKVDRYKILNVCFETDVRVGHVLSTFGILLSDLCFSEETGGKQILLDKTDLVYALNGVPLKSSTVRYDGQNAKLIYQNKALETQVNIIVSFLIHDKITFRKVFFDQSKKVRDKFTFNTYTADESSKVEPFDLIHQVLTERVNYMLFGYYEAAKKPVNFVELNKIVKKALAQTLLVSNKKDIFAWQAPSASVKKGQEGFSILCANGIFKVSETLVAGKSYKTDLEQRMMVEPTDVVFENEFGAGSVVENWILSQHLLGVLRGSSLNLDFRCGVTPYKMSIKKIKTTPLPSPKPLVLPKATHALMTIALSEEVKSAERKLIRRYLSYLEGYTLVEDYSTVDTKAKFEELFNETDIYLPVSHSMDVNRFLVGTQKSKYLVLKKEFVKNGVVREVFLHLLLPSGGAKYTNTLTYDVDSLSDLYSKRRGNKKGSLFLMNISCGSEGTLGTWTHVYRKSVEKDIKKNLGLEMKDFKDLPYIIGSDRGFDTDSTAALAEHINFPLETLRILGEGGTSRDVVSFLKNPVAKGFLDKMTTLVASLSASGDDDEKQGFEPVFNLDIPEMMTYGGFEVELKDVQTGKVQTY